MVLVRITLGFQPRVIRTQTINIFSYCMNKQGITNSVLQEVYIYVSYIDSDNSIQNHFVAAHH